MADQDRAARAVGKMSGQPEYLYDVPCELERIVGGWWCVPHRMWADNCPVERNSQEAVNAARVYVGLEPRVTDPRVTAARWRAAQ